MLKNQIVEFDELRADITVYVAPTLGLKVTDFKSSDDAIAAGKRVKQLRDAIEKKRKELVAPLNDRVREINDYVKQIVGPLLGAEAHLKSQLLVFESEQERIRAEERRRLEEERLAALASLEKEKEEATDAASFFGAEDETPAVTAPLEEKRIAIDNEFAGRAWDINDARIKNTRRTWKFEVVDARLVPPEFLMPNEKAIGAAVKAGARNIPGVRTWQEATVGFGQKTSVSRNVLAREGAE